MNDDRDDAWPRSEPSAADADRLRERLLLDPRDDRAMLALAALVEQANDLPQAIDLCQRALRVDPYNVEALTRLGRLWAALGERDRARHWLERAAGFDPSIDPDAALAALDAAPALTEAYIRTLFDQYAQHFDENLTRDLHYRAPALMADLLTRRGLEHRQSTILDLGCGTGLSGVALRSFARRLDGVDLSPGMLAKARARGLYDTLTEGEGTSYLQAADTHWDIIAAVDVLNYLGDLAPILHAAAARLTPGGLMVGTLEKHMEEKQGGEGFALTAKRRYAHGRAYVESAAREAGLDRLEITEGALRTEGNAPVAGLIFAFTRA